MRCIILLTLVAFAAATPLQEQWTSFKIQYGKSYNSVEEEQLRMAIFLDKQKMIEEHNAKYEAGLSTYYLGMNHFGDMLPEEVTQLGFNITGDTEDVPTFTFEPPANVEIPESVDWRESGAVTPVKNQGHCGSSWAFSSTGAIEGQLFKEKNKLVSLSEQQLVDCSKRFHNNGCKGGNMDNSFNYLKKVAGLQSEESYPYKAKDGKCKFNKNKVEPGTKVKAYTLIPEGDDEALKAAVATVGPISIAVDAGNKDFMHYQGGLFLGDACTDRLNLAVLLIGYGTDEGKEYWLVKNSWSPQWGEKGYMKLTRSKKNACGISTSARYPILKGAKTFLH